MTDPDLTARAQAANRIARAAGALALDYFRRRDQLIIEAKNGPQDVASAADRDVEAMIRAEIAAGFPEDGFMGEESGGAAGSSGFVWVVDPIDGTSPFLHGMAHWCVSIAVLRDGEAVVGAIFDPNAGELYAATLGGGATLDGRPLRRDAGLGLRNGLTGVGCSQRTDPARVARFIAALMGRGGMFFRHGSGAMMLAYVAAGRLAAYWEPHMHAWDCLAAMLMVREAGGRTAPYPGPDGLAGGGAVLAAGPGAWEDLLALDDATR